jgi:site-specific DNA recombinase
VIAALYGRKSTSQEKATAEAKSVTRQIELARDFAVSQGWTVSEDFIFVDDGISGGIFDPKKRPGLAALLRAAHQKPRAFGVLVIMNQSRIGRRSHYVAKTVHELHDLGVRIFQHQTTQEIKFDTATERFLIDVHGFTDESYREACQTTTRETLKVKFGRGDVVGGIVFGYTNICTGCHQPTLPRRTCACKAAIRREPNPSHVPVLIRLFELIRDGWGFIRIAKTFNREGVTPPRRTWSGSAIRSIVFNELYKGVCWYGKTRWQDHGDGKKKIKVDPKDWLRIEKPELRIIPEDLWQATHQRLRTTREAYLRHANGRVWGRPEIGTVSPHLLVGLSVCGHCGASLFVRKRPDGKDKSREPRTYLACSYYHLRGPKACTNAHAMSVAIADVNIRERVKSTILDPTVLRRAIELAAHRYTTQPGDVAQERAQIAKELQTLTKELDGLYSNLANGFSGIGEQIKSRERRQEELKARQAHLDGISKLPKLDTAALMKELDARLTEWRALLDAEPVKSRQILRKLFPNRIAFSWNEQKGLYTFQAEPSYGGLFAGTVLEPVLEPVYPNRSCPRGDSNTRHAV